MKIFELAWTWYEDYRPFLFSHETKTKEDFEADVKSLMIKYGDEYIKQETSWVGASDWIEYISTKMSELGYETVTPERFSIFGAFIVDGNADDDIEFGKIIGEELFEKAIEHNKNLRKEMNKRHEKD